MKPVFTIEFRSFHEIAEHPDLLKQLCKCDYCEELPGLWYNELLGYALCDRCVAVIQKDYDEGER